MASAIETASDFFGVDLDSDRPAVACRSARDAEDHCLKTIVRIDKAVLLLKDLIFRANDGDFDREIGEAYIEGAIALLSLSSANARAVETYISSQIAAENSARREAMDPITAASSSPLPASRSIGGVPIAPIAAASSSPHPAGHA